jgi:hypothetical protein
VPRLAQERRTDGAGEHRVALDEGDRDPDGPETMEVVGRPVQGVHDPPEPSGGSAELLALHGHAGCFLPEEPRDRSLARDVDLRDPVAGKTFGSGARGTSPGPDDLAADQGRPAGHVPHQAGFGRHRTAR